jgi:UDP-N-acetylmuramate dehydrogenase
MEILKEVDLRDYSYIKIGGKAAEIYLPENIEELSELIASSDGNFKIIGNCSNILFPDGRVEKKLISLEKLRSVNILEDGVEVYAGVRTNILAGIFRENNIGGYEELLTIPGTIGGLIYMNGGAYGREIAQELILVGAIDKTGKYEECERRTLDFSYRHSEFMENGKVIVRALLRKRAGFDWEKYVNLLEKRKINQPLEFPNLGSIFKNPEGNIAGKLIDECGLKGERMGGATISVKHANFIVNCGGAKAADVMALIELAKSRVYEKFGISLKEEIEIF